MLQHAVVYLYQDCLLLLKSPPTIQMIKYTTAGQSSATGDASVSSVEVYHEREWFVFFLCLFAVVETLSDK